ncbi:MAG: acyl-CoA thioesterase [Parachlamydia sp.]|nr:acyl-CoA thioesterase [Parachlamydia sp.]
METKEFTYPVTIKEHYLDSLGHMHNTCYQTLFEEALWQMIHENGYGLKELMKMGLAPVLLESTIKYTKELCLRDEIVIVTIPTAHENKIVKLGQQMVRNGEACCIAEFKLGLMDLQNRRLVVPPQEWLSALGLTL